MELTTYGKIGDFQLKKKATKPIDFAILKLGSILIPNTLEIKISK